MIPRSKPASHIPAPEALRALLNASHGSIVVVGSGGWIARAALNLLSQALGREAFLRRVRVLGSSARTIELSSDLVIQSTSLGAWRTIDLDRPFILHTAFLTLDKVGGMPVESYVQRNQEIALEVAALAEHHRAQGLLITSSGAAQKQQDDPKTKSPLNTYGELKSKDEKNFTRLGQRIGMSVSIPRIFALSGEYVNKVNLYALASILEYIRTDKPIEIHAKHAVVRSYAYVGDILSISLCCMLSGRHEEPFDAVTGDPIEIGELAMLASRLLGKQHHELRREVDETLPEDRYVGNGERFAALANRFDFTLVPLPEQIRRTATYLDAASNQ